MEPQKVALGPSNTTVKPDFKEISPNFISMEPEHYTFEPFKITLSMNDTSEGKRIALFISNLTEDSSVVMNLVTNVTKPGEYLNLANVTTDSPERNYTNNFANNTTEVINEPLPPSCDLVIYKSSDKTKYHVNDVMHWIIKVVNNGPDGAKGVYVKDALPVSTKFIKYSASKGSFDAAKGVWKIGDLDYLQCYH